MDRAHKSTWMSGKGLGDTYEELIDWRAMRKVDPADRRGTKWPRAPRY
jgi:hypothetical protein